ncbi:hypothetical protein HY992_04585 [Candidatus Micrarchaeota archaeon]|nr:hypothetical protein [Candidatus Micrarchaeota archaeon]
MALKTPHRVRQGAPAVGREGVKQTWELKPGQTFKPLGAGGFFMQIGKPERAGEKKRTQKTPTSLREENTTVQLHAAERPARIAYVEGKIYLIKNKERKTVGVGKKYDWFKATWISGKRVKATDEQEANAEPGQITSQQSFEFKRLERFRIEQFKQDLVKEARENPNSDCAKFIKQNAQAMNLQIA